MLTQAKVAVTGAFSYSGQYIARAFLDAGHTVSTFTRRPDRPHELQGRITAHPLDFLNPDQLIENLRGHDVLVNTYWVRYERFGSTFAQAIENSRILVNAAQKAGVRRLVHLSVSKPSHSPHLPYFAGKQQVEDLIVASGLSYAILRPTIMFGNEELLISNISWMLKHLPMFVIPGDGKYKVQPVFVEDVAKLAVKVSGENKNQIVDAASPEIYQFKELLVFLKQVTGGRAFLVHIPPRFAYWFSQPLGWLLGDIVLTKEELGALLEERLVVGDSGVGETKFSDWARSRAHLLGARYVSEFARHHNKAG